MMMNNQKSTDEILQALDHARKVSPPKDLIRRMEQVVATASSHADQFSKKTKWMIAASILIIVSLNIMVVICHQQLMAEEQAATTEPYLVSPPQNFYNG